MQVKIKYNMKETYTLHMCCVLSNSIKNLKVLILKSPSVLQARSSLGRSFHSFAAAYSNVDWLIAVLYLGDEVSHYLLGFYGEFLIAMKTTLEVVWDSDSHLRFYRSFSRDVITF